jgi:hypothetical protein
MTATKAVSDSSFIEAPTSELEGSAFGARGRRMQAREKNREVTACDKCYREMHGSGRMRAPTSEKLKSNTWGVASVSRRRTCCTTGRTRWSWCRCRCLCLPGVPVSVPASGQLTTVQLGVQVGTGRSQRCPLAAAVPLLLLSPCCCCSLAAATVRSPSRR